jgi:type II secretory pathway pseudopilin PulG
MERVSLHSKQGMSLVEPLVAMVVLSFSLLGSVSMFALAQDGITEGARKLQAMALAETRLERLRVAAYHTLLTADLDGDGVLAVQLKDSGDEGDAVADDGEYTIRQPINDITVTWTVRPDRPSLATSRMATITVTAAWSDQAGRLRMVRWGMRRANPVFVGSESIFSQILDGGHY